MEVRNQRIAEIGFTGYYSRTSYYFLAAWSNYFEDVKMYNGTRVRGMVRGWVHFCTCVMGNTLVISSRSFTCCQFPDLLIILPSLMKLRASAWLYTPGIYKC